MYENEFKDVKPEVTPRKKRHGGKPRKGNKTYLDAFESCKQWFLYIRRSDSTSDKYKLTLTNFCLNQGVNPDELLKLDVLEIEKLVYYYIEFLYVRVDSGSLSVNTVGQDLNGVQSFLDFHERRVNWKKIYRSLREEEAPDIRPYTMQECIDLLSVADEREKCILLVQMTGGLRVGALVECTLGSLEPLIMENNTIRVGSLKINGFDTGAALIKVHWNSRKWRYFSFITNECRDAINNYLQLRSNRHEKLSPNSPLIRDIFEPYSKFTNS